MANVVPRRNSTQFEVLQPRTSTLRQYGRVYSNTSASSSVPSLVGSATTSTGSEVDLIPRGNFDGNVELPPLTSQPPHQPGPESRSGIPARAPEYRPRTPEPANPIRRQLPFHPSNNPQTNLEEWKSWKIKYPWLFFLLVITISIIATIISLDVISRRDNGFASLTSAPGFLARDPVLVRAIWAQGILYTSFPAFIMTLYRTMWESTVAAFADRQPYVDLRKTKGRPAKATIMLDYKTESALWVYYVAFQNKHYLLSLCFLTSLLLGLLVVPLVAFLFTTDSFTSSTTLPVSILTTFDPTLVFSDPPDLRLSLNSAAAMRIQDARGPPWTDGEFAFPKFLPSATVGDGNITIETTSYSSAIDCQYIPESDYTKVVVPPGTPEYPARSTTIQITASDRGCEINGQISITTVPEFPDMPKIPGMPYPSPPPNILKAWSTFTCSADSGWTRLSMLTARYVNSTSGITNFSLISCVPSYRITPGTLVATTSSPSELSLKAFTPHLSNMTTFRPAALWEFLELSIVEFNCFDKLRNVDADEFMRSVYNIAAKRLPDSPLLPEAIIDAVSTLWSTTFAILATTGISAPLSSPKYGTAIYSVEVSRLIVVSPIAYIILSVLVVVALLNISLFFYAEQESMLFEEPVGLVSAAGILHKSSVNEVVDELVRGQDFNGKVTAAFERGDELMKDRYRFDERQGRIVRYQNAGTPRKSWVESLIKWAREMVVSNNLLNRFRGRERIQD